MPDVAGVLRSVSVSGSDTAALVWKFSDRNIVITVSAAAVVSVAAEGVELEKDSVEDPAEEQNRNNKKANQPMKRRYCHILYT